MKQLRTFVCLLLGFWALLGYAAVATADSPCKQNWWRVKCERNTTHLYTGVSGLLKRKVHWQVPDGTPPPGGWPTVIFYQPSLVSADLLWNLPWITPLDGAYFPKLIKELLDNGYAVLTPVAHLSGYTFWDSNVLSTLTIWDIVPDKYFVDDILSAMHEGAFGPLDLNNLFATGMSSGGYMTSRMAVSYPGVFKALAINSASYATCLGILCIAPKDLPADHPPTLFIHGNLDVVVPLFTMKAYYNQLKEQGIETEQIVVRGKGHQPMKVSPKAIVSWFDQYRE